MLAPWEPFSSCNQQLWFYTLVLHLTFFRSMHSDVTPPPVWLRMDQCLIDLSYCVSIRHLFTASRSACSMSALNVSGVLVECK